MVPCFCCAFRSRSMLNVWQSDRTLSSNSHASDGAPTPSEAWHRTPLMVHYFHHMTLPNPSSSPIGLIAGQGTLPLETARGLRAAGHRVICTALAGQTLKD